MDELAKERYDLAVERIREIREEKTVAEPYLDFFTKTAGFLEEMIRLREPGGSRRDEKTVPGRAAPGEYAGAIRIFCRRTTRLPMQVRIMRQRCWEKI